MNRGFTMPELLLTMGIFAILAGLITMSLLGGQRTASLSTTVDVFIADLKEQQIKAMVGDTQGSGTLSNYGIRFGTTEYTLFRDTYGTGNFVVSVPNPLTVSTTFPSSEIVFQKGSGEISGFTSGANTVTFTDTTNTDAQTMTINRYGVVTAVN